MEILFNDDTLGEKFPAAEKQLASASDVTRVTDLLFESFIGGSLDDDDDDGGAFSGMAADDADAKAKMVEGYLRRMIKVPPRVCTLNHLACLLLSRPAHLRFFSLSKHPTTLKHSFRTPGARSTSSRCGGGTTWSCASCRRWPTSARASAK